jgi:diadenosine tetraphosphatase ApaH/serine/threonine PP2A family protein phosphatase
MANPHDHPTALKDLQDSIYRERVLRSRSLTPEQRIADVFEMAEFSIHMAHAGAMHQLGTSDPQEGWQLVKVWNERLRRAHDYRFYVTERSKSA